MHWVLVGPNHRETRPKHGGVLRHYTRCTQVPTGTFKTVANTYFLSRTDRHPHNFKFACVPVATPLAGAASAALQVPTLANTRTRQRRALCLCAATGAGKTRETAPRQTRRACQPPRGHCRTCLLPLRAPRAIERCNCDTALANTKATCRKRTAPVNEGRWPAGVSTGNAPGCRGLSDATRDCPWQSAAGLPRKHASTERVALMHYGTKSRQDFENKVARGPGGPGASKRLEFFERYERCA